MSDDKSDIPDWLDKFADTPEGKVASVGVALIPTIFGGIVGFPLILGGTTVYGLRRLFGK
jgi:hypothetical protein